MTIPPLPTLYARRIAAQLGDAAQAYLDALLHPPLRGLRQNPLKAPDAPLATLVDGLGEPVPWAKDGFYLSRASSAGLAVLHEAGAYYLQEPSAMLPANVLAPAAGETVLDLCAAPGGKSTQLAAAMTGQGTLVVNEPVPARAAILSRIMERMGVRNAVVTCMDPAQLAMRWPALFDAVLVDAPCSGEGMFRRHPETRLEWHVDAPARCATRQRRILESALTMLKAGGRLCYSTCTFSEEENEQVIASLLHDHPALSSVPFRVPLGGGRLLAAPDGQARLWPHEAAGEGHFTSLLRKDSASQSDASRPAQLLSPAQALAAPPKQMLALYDAFRQTMAGASRSGAGGNPLPEATAMLGETLLAAPPLPPLQGVRVLRAGLALGQAKGSVFAPDHALAMAAPPCKLPSVPLDSAAARAYQRGESLPAPESLRGYVALTHQGLALGFAKASDGQLKNHYPKGLRRP